MHSPAQQCWVSLNMLWRNSWGSCRFGLVTALTGKVEINQQWHCGYCHYVCLFQFRRVLTRQKLLQRVCQAGKVLFYLLVQPEPSCFLLRLHFSTIILESALPPGLVCHSTSLRLNPGMASEFFSYIDPNTLALGSDRYSQAKNPGFLCLRIVS